MPYERFREFFANIRQLSYYRTTTNQSQLCKEYEMRFEPCRVSQNSLTCMNYRCVEHCGMNGKCNWWDEFSWLERNKHNTFCDRTAEHIPVKVWWCTAFPFALQKLLTIESGNSKQIGHSSEDCWFFSNCFTYFRIWKFLLKFLSALSFANLNSLIMDFGL